MALKKMKYKKKATSGTKSLRLVNGLQNVDRRLDLLSHVVVEIFIIEQFV